MRTDRHTITSKELEMAKKELEESSGDLDTICDCLRLMYQGLQSKPEFNDVCTLAVVYAKRMDRKLRYYKGQAEQGKVANQEPQEWR
jgi:hypothetical protein